MTRPLEPYLMRAYYEWIVDNGWTPHLMVDASDDQVQVPPGHRSSQLVLNIGPSAVVDLLMDNTEVCFGARFGGVAHVIRVPLPFVQAIFARENQQGIAFGEGGVGQASTADQLPPDDEPDPAGGGGRPGLRLVK